MIKKSINLIIHDIKLKLDNFYIAYDFDEPKEMKKELFNIILEVNNLIDEYISKIER